MKTIHFLLIATMVASTLTLTSCSRNTDVNGNEYPDPNGNGQGQNQGGGNNGDPTTTPVAYDAYPNLLWNIQNATVANAPNLIADNNYDVNGDFIADAVYDVSVNVWFQDQIGNPYSINISAKAFSFHTAEQCKLRFIYNQGTPAGAAYVGLTKHAVLKYDVLTQQYNSVIVFEVSDPTN